MKFRKFAVEMTDAEINQCLSILVEGSELIRFRRDEGNNSINVRFRVLGDRRREEYDLILLSDSVVEITNNIPLRADGEYLYRQFMIANGFSEYWSGNIFIENHQPDKMEHLKRFLNWITKHYNFWEALCEASYAALPIAEKSRMFDSLVEEGLLAVAYLMICQSANDSRQMETVKEKMQNQCLTEISPEKIIEYIRQGVETEISKAESPLS